MEAFDTNVVVRLLVRDDEEQCKRAERILREAIVGGGAWLPTIVLVETAWVPRVAYRFDRATTAAALQRLLNVEGVVVEDDVAVRAALGAFEVGRADFSDYLILAVARRAEADPLWTFDERLAPADGAKLVP